VALEAAAGENSTAKLHTAPGRSVPHVVVEAKSVGTTVDKTWIVVVPVFVSITICAAETLPICVLANVSELCDKVKALRTAEVAGSLDTKGVTTPPKTNVSGLEIASLSRSNAPVSERGVALEPARTSSIGA
jgi:hypothetical protein